MRFSIISAIATLGSLVTAQHAAHAFSHEQAVEGLNGLARKAQDLQAHARSIYAPHAEKDHGPFKKINAGHDDLISRGKAYMEHLAGAEHEAYHAEQCAAVFESFKGFVHVNQGYLNILGGKAGIAEKVGHEGHPMEASLKQVEHVYDGISHHLINLCPSHAEELKSHHAKLDGALSGAIEKYHKVAEKYHKIA